MCGGTPSNVQSNSDQCWRYHPDNTWKASGTTRAKRVHAASAEHPTLGLVIAGGFDESGTVLRSVETTDDGKEFKTPFGEV